MLPFSAYVTPPSSGHLKNQLTFPGWALLDPSPRQGLFGGLEGGEPPGDCFSEENEYPPITHTPTERLLGTKMVTLGMSAPEEESGWVSTKGHPGSPWEASGGDHRATGHSAHPGALGVPIRGSICPSWHARVGGSLIDPPNWPLNSHGS